MNTIKFPNIFNLSTGKTQVSSGRVSVEESLRLLLSTTIYELLGDPEYGSRISQELFEPNSNILSDILKHDIINSVTKYEQRVILYEDDITIYSDHNNVNIEIVYYLVKTGNVETFELVLSKEDRNSGQEII